MSLALHILVYVLGVGYVLGGAVLMVLAGLAFLDWIGL